MSRGEHVSQEAQAFDKDPIDEELARGPKPRKQDRATLALLAVAGLIAMGGVGFAVGRSTAPAGTPTGNGNGAFPGGGRGAFGSFVPGGSFNPGGGAFRIGGAGITGTVESIDSGSMTVKLADGSTVTILLTGTTTYHSETAATAGDVQTGTTVRVQVTTGAQPGGSPAAGSSTRPGSRTLTAGDVLITGS
jgi:hypothetical protein